MGVRPVTPVAPSGVPHLTPAAQTTWCVMTRLHPSPRQPDPPNPSPCCTVSACPALISQPFLHPSASPPTLYPAPAPPCPALPHPTPPTLPCPAQYRPTPPTSPPSSSLCCLLASSSLARTRAVSDAMRAVSALSRFDFRSSSSDRRCCEQRNYTAGFTPIRAVELTSEQVSRQSLVLHSTPIPDRDSAGVVGWRRVG